MDKSKELYEEKRKQILAKMIVDEIDTIEHNDGLVSVNKVQSGKRNFMIDGVKAALGDKASACIEEVVIPTKFDAIVGKQEKCILTEEKKRLCFTVKPSDSLVWEGLNAYLAVQKAQEQKDSPGQ